MKRTHLKLGVWTVVSCLVAGGAAVAVAQEGEKKADEQAMQLPEGWSAEDMQACMLAGTPGDMHTHLAKGAGEWHGEGTMWMGPDGEGMPYESTANISVVMDGRYVKCEYAGELPGMGSFHGVGFNGFDNVEQKFVTVWMDNHSTGFMNGTGELSADKKTMTWTYSYTCPITQKPAKMRQIERTTGEDTMTMEMFGSDPKTGKEFKMMHLNFTRKPGSGPSVNKPAHG